MPLRPRAALAPFLAALGALGGLLWAPSARAARIENGDHPIQLDFTEDAQLDLRFSQGNGIIAPPGDSQYDPTADKYFEWLNRFEIQLNTGPWHADLRFDSALFLNRPTVSDTATLTGQRLFRLLEARYVDNFQLEKISASYTSRNLDATIGDFYLSYGRGLVISLRKIDALGVDTTLRGVTVTGRYEGLSANLSAGFTNIVNTDQATGYVAPDPEDPIVAARIEYRWGQILAFGIDGAVFWQNPSSLAYLAYQPPDPMQPVNPTQSVNLSPLGFGSVQVAESMPGSALPPVRRVLNYGATLEFPNLLGHGNAYVEYVHQQQAQTQYGLTMAESIFRSKDTTSIFDLNYNTAAQNGDGFYAGVNAFFGDFTLQVELKDYQNFTFPILSSLPSMTFLSFYQQEVYSNPPNLEQIWQEESYTTHIYGPKLRIDWQLSEQFKPFALADDFVDQDNAFDIYDGALGLDFNWEQHRSHAAVSGGYRREVYNSFHTGSVGLLHATEFWFQYDVIQRLNDQYSLELDGLHRTHRDYIFSPIYLLWHQGYAYLSLRRSKWSVSAGFEYYTYSPNLYQPWYPNVSGTYTISDNLLVRGFVGGREAGLRCINGICRTFPGFNGATVELVAKY